MSNKAKDIGIVIFVSALVFYFDPAEKIFNALGGRKDGGLSFAVVISIIVAITAMMISLQYYWKCVIATNFGGTAMTLLNYYVRDWDYYLKLSANDSIYRWFFNESLINGLFFLVLSLPTAKLVLVIRRKLGGRFRK